MFDFNHNFSKYYQTLFSSTEMRDREQLLADVHTVLQMHSLIMKRALFRKSGESCMSKGRGLLKIPANN